MRSPALLELSVENFRSFQRMKVELGPLNVLVGPNGAGKSNLLSAIAFLGEAAENDLRPAIIEQGGIESIRFRGATEEDSVQIAVKCLLTRHATTQTPDEYTLRFRHTEPSSQSKAKMPELSRTEHFTFRGARGARQQIRIEGTRMKTTGGGKTRTSKLLRQDSLGLSTLPRLDIIKSSPGIFVLANMFSQFRVMDVDVDAAREPDASNLASFLSYLSEDENQFELLQEDIRAFIPGVERLHLRTIGGSHEAVVVELEEHGLPGRTPLAHASFGTVRLLALLAMLHDPAPPFLTCIEEIDHGLHPYVFDRLVERLRAASKRTQFLIATHSPAFVNRLSAEELIVCECDAETGASRIPATPKKTVARMLKEVGDSMRLGELWFSGSLGGVP
jgi:predicted ATPase